MNTRPLFSGGHVAKAFTGTDRFVITLPKRCLYALVLLVLCFIALLATPQMIWAKSYSMPQVDIHAQVEPDGSLHVVESRTFDFSGSFSAVWWTFSKGDITVSSVSDSKTGDLPAVPFRNAWRESGGPSQSAYSVDTETKSVYVFFDADDEMRTFTIDYTIDKVAIAYADTADLLWQYVGDKWKEDSENISVTLSLPVPEGEKAIPGENVLTWGHSSEQGTVAFSDTGDEVLISQRDISPGAFGEVRVEFPPSWLTEVSSGAQNDQQSRAMLDSIKQEEQKLADEAEARHFQALVFIGVFCLIALAFIVFCFVVWRSVGKDHKPTQSLDYWRDVPQKGVHPAVISLLWNGKLGKSNAMTATILHLAHVGALTIGTVPQESGNKKKNEVAYYIQKNPNAESKLSNDIDRKMMTLLFDQIASETSYRGDSQTLLLSQVAEYGKDHPQEYTDAVDVWWGMVEAHYNVQDYYEAAGDRWRGIIWTASVIIFILGAMATFALENFIPGIAGFVAAVAGFSFGQITRRKTQQGTDVYERCRALKQWFLHFSSLDERPPTDVIVWGEFMIYAFILGVAKEAIAQLRDTVPSLFAEDSFSSGGMWYAPYYYYGYSGNSGFDSFAETFNTTLANTQATVTSALSSVDGSGLGGGFSVGGGGGFGGGGGGAR